MRAFEAGCVVGEDLLARLCADGVEPLDHGALPDAGQVLAEQQVQVVEDDRVEVQAHEVRARGRDALGDVGEDRGEVAVQAQLLVAAMAHRIEWVFEGQGRAREHDACGASSLPLREQVHAGQAAVALRDDVERLVLRDDLVDDRQVVERMAVGREVARDEVRIDRRIVHVDRRRVAVGAALVGDQHAVRLQQVLEAVEPRVHGVGRVVVVERAIEARRDARPTIDDDDDRLRGVVDRRPVRGQEAVEDVQRLVPLAAVVERHGHEAAALDGVHDDFGIDGLER